MSKMGGRVLLVRQVIIGKEKESPKRESGQNL
jgi:hypothetical protein